MPTGGTKSSTVSTFQIAMAFRFEKCVLNHCGIGQNQARAYQGEVGRINVVQVCEEHLQSSRRLKLS